MPWAASCGPPGLGCTPEWRLWALEVGEQNRHASNLAEVSCKVKVLDNVQQLVQKSRLLLNRLGGIAPELQLELPLDLLQRTNMQKIV